MEGRSVEACRGLRDADTQADAPFAGPNGVRDGVDLQLPNPAIVLCRASCYIQWTMASPPSLAEITSRTMAAFPSAERIVLFGSRGRGTPASDSDFDLLVVTPTLLLPVKRSARLRLALRALDASFDLIVVTPEEYARLLPLSSSIVARAAAEGIVLHAA